MMERARSFIWHNARVLEQRRFEFLFDGGEAAPVLAALLAYRNADGGYGHALEPDGRGPTSQPLHVNSALNVLGELGESKHMVQAADHLAGIASPDGSLPMALPTMREYPHAPWWAVDETGGLLVTALVAGVLHSNEIDHPWLAKATDYCWDRIAGLSKTHPYEVNACVRFLDHVPDRTRAEGEAERIGKLVRQQRLVDLDEPDAAAPEGYAEGELHRPDDYAPEPTSLARRWFTDAEMERSLDRLAADQKDDGGWTFAWPRWAPVTEYEWRPIITIESLLKLRAYDRIS
jgi:hypothetical protein